MLLLEVTQGLAAGKIFELPGEVVTIGRAPSNEVILDDMHVSGEHARVLIDGTRFVLHDLRSTNGTSFTQLAQVNGNTNKSYVDTTVTPGTAMPMVSCNPPSSS